MVVYTRQDCTNSSKSIKRLVELKSFVQLRESFAVGDYKFKLYKDFKKYTFGHAVKEINVNYDMNLNFEEIKEGRKVAAVKFTFKKVIVKKVTNNLTGVASNVYSKYEKKQKAQKNKIMSNLSSVLEGQLSLLEVVK